MFWPINHQRFLKALASDVFIFVSTSPSLFNSFSKFYSKFTCSLDAPSHFRCCFYDDLPLVHFNCLWSIDTHHHFMFSSFFSFFPTPDWLPQELRLFANNIIEIWRWNAARRHGERRFESPAGKIELSRVQTHDGNQNFFSPPETRKHRGNWSAWWCNERPAKEAKMWKSWFRNHTKPDKTSQTKALRSRTVTLGESRDHVEVSLNTIIVVTKFFKGHCYQKHEQVKMLIQ